MKIDIKERFLRAPEVVQRTGMSRGTIYNKIHAGTFPKQIPIGANLVVWLESDLQKQWLPKLPGMWVGDYLPSPSTLRQFCHDLGLNYLY